MVTSEGTENFERSLEIVQTILDRLKELQTISPCTSGNCPHIEEFDAIGECTDKCRFISLQRQKNKITSWLCGP